jgi:hypothetical protein
MRLVDIERHASRQPSRKSAARPSVSFRARHRTHAPGHIRSYRHPQNHLAGDRSQGTAEVADLRSLGRIRADPPVNPPLRVRSPVNSRDCGRSHKLKHRATGHPGAGAIHAAHRHRIGDRGASRAQTGDHQAHQQDLCGSGSCRRSIGGTVALHVFEVGGGK